MKPVDEQKRRANVIKQMIESEGWQIVEQELIEESKRLHSQYLNAADGSPEERMAKYDERALRQLLNKIRDYAAIQPL